MISLYNCYTCYHTVWDYPKFNNGLCESLEHMSSPCQMIDLQFKLQNDYILTTWSLVITPLGRCKTSFKHLQDSRISQLWYSSQLLLFIIIDKHCLFYKREFTNNLEWVSGLCWKLLCFALLHKTLMFWNRLCYTCCVKYMKQKFAFRDFFFFSAESTYRSPSCNLLTWQWRITEMFVFVWLVMPFLMYNNL